MLHSHMVDPRSTVLAVCPIASSLGCALPPESSSRVEAASALSRKADSDKPQARWGARFLHLAPATGSRGPRSPQPAAQAGFHRGEHRGAFDRAVSFLVLRPSSSSSPPGGSGYGVIRVHGNRCVQCPFLGRLIIGPTAEMLRSNCYGFGGFLTMEAATKPSTKRKPRPNKNPVQAGRARDRPSRCGASAEGGAAVASLTGRESSRSRIRTETKPRLRTGVSAHRGAQLTRGVVPGSSAHPSCYAHGSASQHLGRPGCGCSKPAYASFGSVVSL